MRIKTSGGGMTLMIVDGASCSGDKRLSLGQLYPRMTGILKLTGKPEVIRDFQTVNDTIYYLRYSCVG